METPHNPKDLDELLLSMDAMIVEASDKPIYVETRDIPDDLLEVRNSLLGDYDPVLDIANDPVGLRAYKNGLAALRAQSLAKSHTPYDDQHI